MSRAERDDVDRSPSRLVRARRAVVAVVRDAVLTVVVVSLAGLVLFAAGGVWPPLVAVESGSMEPHVQRGDLVFVGDPGRFGPGTGAPETDVVPAETARETGYRSLGDHGSVVVYSPPGRTGSPIIHRALFRVSNGENWFERANTDRMAADDCGDLPNCPAPNAGFVTKGDANPLSDQAAGVSPPVRPEWITATAHVRLPDLGWVRLVLA